MSGQSAPPWLGCWPPSLGKVHGQYWPHGRGVAAGEGPAAGAGVGQPAAGAVGGIGQRGRAGCAEFAEEGNARILGVRRPIALETAALLAFATLGALAGLLLVGQALGRQVLLESTEYPTLRALGMTRGQLVGIAIVRTAVVGPRAPRAMPWG